ncbi:hypothetical protein AVL62_13955 [Serinicoccus chungangensis]|uniref:Uncharacterized protein n=1 Tax=Serinicoccus chungangensis TaxID=767452 RepID=A0A0W8I3N5_9MICO|nr:hypothetical protein [Serinicoccus chungangensis]KUG52436.1 hypothetical protein AVL62_13955 [Serinicoccus chungangensis]
MPYRYGQRWHGKLRKPIGEITEAEAERRFTHGPFFSVSRVDDLSGGAVPDFTLSIDPDGMYVGSVFYDEFGSEVKKYHFDEEAGRPGHLFLREVVVTVYPDGQDKWLSLRDSKAHRSLLFQPDGRARSYLAVKGEPAAKVEEFTGVDVSAHWVPMITFGDWDRFGEHREPGLGD